MGAGAGISQISANLASINDGANLAAYLTDAAGDLITSTLVGAKQSIDSLDAASHLDGAAYAAGVDYLSSSGAVDESGNWQPLRLNAANELLVNATVSFTSEYEEDTPAPDGFTGIATLLVRQDTLAVSTTTDGDFGAFKSNNLGELYVHDTSVLAQLVLIKSDTASIVTNTATTATNTGTISSTLTALSHADGAAWAASSQGIESLGVRQDAFGPLTGVATGDWSPFQTWSEGSVKTVDIANSSVKSTLVAVANTATLLPATPLANRRSILVQNVGNGPAYIGGSTVTVSGATTGYKLAKDSFIEFDIGPAVSLYGIVASGTQDLVCVEAA